METVGEFFRQVRETKGLTLDALASKTCIHPDFLRALEENNFAKLPDQVFVKGFVRSYARSLGVDEADAMRHFLESAGPFYEKQGERERLRIKEAEDERRRRTSRQVAVAATVVALLGLVMLLTREQSVVSPGRQAASPTRSGPAKPEAPVSSGTGILPQPERSDGSKSSGEPSGTSPVASGPSPGPVAVTRQEVPSISPPVSGASGSLPVESLPPVDLTLVLDLEALELSWVLLQIDDGSIQEVLLRPGERVRWRAADHFTLTLGNAGGVRVELDGKEQGPFGPKGKVARDIVLKR
jgi:cytoskeletal protein RodZ